MINVDKEKIIIANQLVKEKAYWLEKLSGKLEYSSFPRDLYKKENTYKQKMLEFDIPKYASQKLISISGNSDYRLHMLLIAAMVILVGKYTGNSDIILGSVIYKEDNERQLANKILPIRCKLSMGISFKELLLLVRQIINECVDNRNYPFEKLILDINVPENKNAFPLFDVMVLLENIQDTTYIEAVKTNIKYIFKRKQEQVKLCLSYNDNLYSLNLIKKITANLINLLILVVDNINIKIAEIEMVTEEEKRQMLEEFNKTNLEYLRYKTIQQLLEEQAFKTPEKEAVIYEGTKLTYRQLNENSNCLARILRTKGAKQEDVIAIMAKPSLEIIIGVIGVIKSGAAYVPIDPDYPKDRIRYMLEDCGARFLLTQKNLKNIVDKYEIDIIELDEEENYSLKSSNIEIINEPNDLAYIIYTSGSTGKPKGTEIEHKSLLNLSLWFKDYYEIDESTISTKYASIGFDASIMEIFPFLIGGATLHIISEDIRMDIKKLNEYYKDNGVNISFLPTQLCEQFMEEENNSLKKLLTGGDKLNSYKKKSYKLINNYGPTENTVVATCYEVKHWKHNIPIGKPITNTRIYILDKNQKIQPIGVAGELYISGVGLARGYLNCPELTLEKFVQNPFIEGERMYRTGDMARWLPDGNIEFLGRIGNQVKIRGYRIELGEIENQLLEYTAIKEAVVIVKSDDREDKYLTAYFVADKRLIIGDLREYLKTNLPEYMIPSYFIHLDAMPLTANGKIDRKALPEPERLNNTGVEYESPRNEVEQKLEELWRDILKIEKIGINDDFFELGGHSIRATILAARIRKEMNVDVSIKEVFIFPTIKGMAKYILSSEKRIYNAIEPLDEKPYYIVSSIQKRIYILQEMDEKSTIYNMPEILLIEGKLDKTRVQVTFKKLVQRHEALRTSFEIIGDEIVQKVHQEIKFKIDYYKVQKEQTEETEEIIRNFIKYFDLSIAPLFRIGIIELSEETHVLMMDMHHIISDGTSREIFIKDFASLYDGEELKELKIQYKDFAEWQRSELKKDKMKKQEEYWLKVFEGELPVLNIPSDYPRPAVKSNEGSHYGFIIDELLYRHIKEFARKNELTIFMVLLASLSITLAKYSRQDDITIGSVMAGRDNADIEDVIGVFLNNIAFRCRPNGDKKVIEYLTEIKECVLEGYENQSYPIEETIEKLKLNRDLSRNALFDIMLIYQNYQKYEQKIATSDWDIKPYKSEHNVSDYDMTFYVDEAGDKLDVYLQFYTRIYNSKTIQRFAEHWINTIRQMMSESEKELRKIKIAAENEKNLILGQLVGNIGQYPKEKTLQQLFEEQEELTPKNIALVYKNQQVTYEELNRKSNQLAENLRKQGVNPDSIVGVMAEKSIDMMVGILAVLKAGGAYLPIDPLYPKERIKYMLEDSGAEILLVQGKLKETVDFKGQTLCLEDESLYDGNGNNLLSINDSSNLAYVIYTSGTTGQPKGIMTEHRNVIAYITEFNRKFGISAKDTTLQQASITFDGFVEETYTVLTKGGKVVIPDQEQVKEAEELKELIDRYQVTILSCSPLILNQLNSLEPMKSVHTYLSSSDVLKKEYYSNIIKYAKVYNMYGPTETTVCTTCYHCTGAEENVSIGKPIANYSVYILDEGKNILPIGVPGEIYISGEGVSRGYINKLELAKEKFIDNPFIEGKRMYRTGDLGRWLPDGNIEFMGRSDHQVKIRGYRIELGEIESRLLGNKDVKDAVIIVKSDDIGDKHLTAYFIADKQLTIGELREYLKNDLPEYMIPSYFVQLDKMPLTPNGKIDKKALPEPKKLINTGAAYEAPRNETEQKLVELWQDILKVERIGINDNFFELGGHSLKATILAARIQQELEVKVSIKEIFKLVTVKEFAEYIVSCQKSRYYEIKPAEKMEYYPVSSVQKRLYTLQNIELGGTAYNLPQVLVLEGNIDKEKIEKAFRELVFRHEILRTSFEFIEGEILQKINEDIDFNIEYYEEDKDERIEFIVKSFIRPFDLSEAPLIRIGLIKIATSKYILMTDMHHIVSDGTSIQILIDDFIRLYEGKELNELKLQYKDYAVWQNDILKKDEMQKQESYWLNEFAGEIPVLNMPADKARPLLKSSGGGNYSFAIDERISANLKNFALENKATIFMALLEAYSLTLSKYSNQEDIIIGTVTAGREHADIQSLIGVFLNSIAFRCIPNKGKTVADYLQEIKETVLKGYENQSYPFEEIINKLNLNRDLSRNALFDVMLIYQNFEKQNESAESMDFNIDNYESGYYSADYDMTMYVDEIGDRLEINVLYYSEIFEKASIERFAGHFTNVLDQLIKNPQKKLQDINMLQEEERELVLKEFNNTAMEYPREKSIKELIEETVEKVPEKTAVVFKDEKLTYQQLNEKSNQLARMLREKGISNESIVGIMVERSVEMVIAALAVLKSGGAYLAIDLEYPEDRIEYMLNDSNVRVLLTDQDQIESIPQGCIKINVKNGLLYTGDSSNLEDISKPSDLAYIIYTSGTTGMAKGVMVEQKNLLNMVYAWKKSYGLEEFDVRLLQIASMSFDVFPGDLMRVFTNRGTMVICPKEARLDPAEFYNLIKDNGINIFETTPSLGIPMMEYIYENKLDISSMKILVLGGDSCLVEDFKRLNERFSNTMRIINNYGIAEATIDSSFYEMNESIGSIVNLPIGKPMQNIKYYILDEGMNPKAVGQYGELYVGGEGVARGYLNKPELTAERFIEDCFLKKGRMYKTGDIARWLLDGNVEFVGRIDNQVKIRGYRIELGEIENALRTFKEMKDAVVTAREDERGKYLCGYLVSDNQIDMGAIRKQLVKQLPDYMVPSYFVQLDKMPLTPNGKVDRKALPKPEGHINTGEEYEAPRNETEQKLAELWQDILKVENIGINDNFFELGGHSLTATVLIAKIYKELEVKVPLREIFEKTTIRALAVYIESREKNRYAEILKVEEKEYYPVSSAQKRMYILQQFDIEITAYDIADVIEIEGNLDIIRLEDSFRKLIGRHETLRTSFEIIEGEIVQKIHKNIDFEIEYWEETEEERINERIRNFVRPFDLSKAPLLRVGLIKVHPERHILIYDIHHIVSDGTSMEIIAQEIWSLYENEELENLKIQYKDYAVWQNKLVESDDYKKQESYWINKFKGQLPALNLPIDYDRPAIQNFQGKSFEMEFGKELTERLEELTRVTETTLYMVLLAAYNILLHKFSGQSDIIVGSPIAGRPYDEMQNLIGMFVNTLAMRNRPEGEKSFAEFLQEVKKGCLEAYENQDYQFDEMVERLKIRSKADRNPIFNTMFILQNTISRESSLKDINCKWVKEEINTEVKVDIAFTVIEESESLKLIIEYMSAIFNKETVVILGEKYLQILNNIITNQDTQIKDIILSKSFNVADTNILAYDIEDFDFGE